MSKIRSTYRRRRKPSPNYVIVPKTQMRAKKPAMVIDPGNAVVTQLTDDQDKALKFKSRSGAFRHVKKFKELSKRFWYRRVA